MQEWTQQQVLDHTEAVLSPLAIFFYTPLCGTCKLTERMLNIILSMEPKLPVYKSNLNFLPRITMEWRISSVPCIVIIEAGGVKRMIYQMKSVDELYKQLSSLR